jgi:tRNA 2-thiouridine synthesizing protein A
MKDVPNDHGEAAAVREIDARGLICPLPVLRARKALAALRPGDLLRIKCTDPAAAADFPAYCQTAGHTLVETAQQCANRSRDDDRDDDRELIFLIRRGT